MPGRECVVYRGNAAAVSIYAPTSKRGKYLRSDTGDAATLRKNSQVACMCAYV